MIRGLGLSRRTKKTDSRRSMRNSNDIVVDNAMADYIIPLHELAYRVTKAHRRRCVELIMK